MKTALGIDLSTVSTGLVLLRESHEADMADLVFDELVKVPVKVKGIQRYIAVVTHIMERIEEHKPDRIVVEGYSLNMKHASSVIPLVELGGMLRFMLHLDGLSWLDPRATELKKFVTGKGTSKKEEVMLHVFKRWEYSAANSDLADAYVLACMGLLHIGALKKSTNQQREIIGTLPLKCN